MTDTEPREDGDRKEVDPAPEPDNEPADDGPAGPRPDDE